MRRFFSVTIIASVLVGLSVQPVLAATLGRTTIGNSSFVANPTICYGTLFTASATFVVNSLSVRVLTPSATGSWYACIYDVDGSDLPVNLLSKSATTTVVSDSWNSVAMPAFMANAGQSYYVMAIFGASQSISMNTPEGTTHEKDGAPTNPFGLVTTTLNHTIAIYASGPLPTMTNTPTYTATYTYTHTPTITLTNTPTYTSTVTKTYTITITSTISPTSTVTQTITLTGTATPTLSPTITPTDVPFKLDRNKIMAYPSPARGDMMRFYVYTPAQSHLTIEIFNIIGEKGDTIEIPFTAAGYKRIPWDIRNVSPGIYFYRTTIQSPEGIQTFPVRKFVIIKGQ